MILCLAFDIYLQYILTTFFFSVCVLGGGKGVLTLSQKTNLRPSQTENNLQTTILNCMKMAESYPNG